MSEIPVLFFPRRVILHGEWAGFTGEVLGVHFTRGLSAEFLSARTILHMTAAQGAVEDAATGIMLSPTAEDVTYRIDWESRLWTSYSPLPSYVAEQDQQIAERLAGRFETVVIAPEPETAPNALPGIERVVATPELRALIDEIDLAATLAKPEERIAAAISKLDKSDKAVWTRDGKPDAVHLTSLLGFTVTSSMRDRAWQMFQDQAGDIRTVLQNIAGSRGARFLRQLCEDKKWPAPKNADDLIEVLAERLTIAEARAL